MRLMCRILAPAWERAVLAGHPVPSHSHAGQHLGACDRCRDEYDRMLRAVGQLERMWETPQPSDGFMVGVWRQVQAVEPGRSAAPLRWAAAGACSVLVLAAAGGLGRRPHPGGSGAGPAPAVTSQAFVARPPVEGIDSPGRRAGVEGAPAASHVPQAVPSTPAGASRPAGGAVIAPERKLVRADAEYLDGSGGELLHRWVSGFRPGERPPSLRLSQVRDDFVEVELPRVAEARGSRAGLAAAVDQYEKEAKVVDTRLFRKVTLQLKGASLQELCAELARQTGVRLRASRGVRDEKVTVLVRDQPARDVMRAVARLLALVWSRSGEAESYEYELNQTLKARLTEEELRNADVHASLLALDEEMAAYRPYLSLSLDQLRARLARAQGAEKTRLSELVEKGGWGAVQAYARLSPADRLALVAGQELTLSEGGEDPGRRLPDEWAGPILGSFAEPFTIGIGKPTIQGQGTRLDEYPNAAPEKIRLRIERTELGVFSLESHTIVKIPIRGHAAFGRTWDFDYPCSIWNTPAVGRSRSATQPENARANAALRKEPFFGRKVSLRPQPAPRVPVELPEVFRTGDPGPRLTTAEFWEAVHRETGAPVVADFYTRLYPVGTATVTEGTLFDALCRAGDALGARWTQDGGFLMGRSTTFFWDKLKEVPKSQLERWSADRAREGGLPAEDFLEMASMSDLQLDSAYLSEGLAYLWGLHEWKIAGGPRHPWSAVAGIRSYARFIASLTADQRQRVLSAGGLGWSQLTPLQQVQLLQLAPTTTLATTPPAQIASVTLRAVYVPAGWYAWAPLSSHPPRGAGKTQEAALVSARMRKADAGPDGVALSGGDFGFFLELRDPLHSELHSHRFGTGGAWRGKSF